MRNCPTPKPHSPSNLFRLPPLHHYPPHPNDSFYQKYYPPPPKMSARERGLAFFSHLKPPPKPKTTTKTATIPPPLQPPKEIYNDPGITECLPASEYQDFNFPDLVIYGAPTCHLPQKIPDLMVKEIYEGICKSKWDKKGNCPPGVYEYIDVLVEGTRYIVEVSLATEFEIARQTSHYTSLLQLFPTIFVGEIRIIKKIARLMCQSMKISMKRGDFHVPPWRRLAYMQAKWLGKYRRTINEVPKTSQPIDIDLGAMRSIGFVAVPPTISGYCRESFSSRSGGRKVGNLALAFATSPMLL